MDEQKDKDVSVFRGGLGESTVTVREHAAGRSETPAQSIACEAQGRIGEARVSGGREDIMVEVVGSHVLVDGVCGNDIGDRTVGEENLNDEEIDGHGDGSVDAGVERDLRSVSGGDDAVGNSGTIEVHVSVTEVSSSHGLKTEVGGKYAEERAAGESVERNTEVIAGDGGGSIVGEISSHENGGGNDYFQNIEIGTRVEGSTAHVGSAGGETHVVYLEDNVVAAEEESMGRGSAQDDVEKGYEAQDLGAKNVVGSSMVAASTLIDETQLVEEKIVWESANAGEKERVKGTEQGRERDAAGEDVCKDVEPRNLGILDDALNPGIQTAVAGSLAVVECSRVQMKVVEKAAVLAKEDGLNTKIYTFSCNTAESVTSSLEEKQILIDETDNGGAGKDRIITARSNTLDERNPIAVSGEVAEMDKGEFMCSSMEGMETDTFDENLSFSLEELQGNIGRVAGSTENRHNVFADSPPFCEPIQVVGSEGAAMDKRMHPDSENHEQGDAYDVVQVDTNTQQAMEIDEKVTTAELNRMLSCSGDVHTFNDETPSMDTELNAQVSGRGDEIPLINNQEVLNSNVEFQIPAESDQQLELEGGFNKSGMVVEQEVDDAEQVSSDIGLEMDVQKQPKIVETIAGSNENYRNVCFDPITTGQQTHEAFGGDVTAMDDKVPSNPTVEVPHSTYLDCVLSCSEIGGDIAPMESKEFLNSKVEGEGDKSAPDDRSEIDSTMRQEMQVEDLVIDTEHGGKEIEAEEQASDTEQPESNEEKFVKRAIKRGGSLATSHQSSYQLPLGDEGEFYVSDLVWGKVRSHPWWPGQIYDPSDASEKAMKYHKKDCFLVAYFGDRTFAWVDACQLKPFYSHFSQVEKQSNSEVFQNAVSCALEEVCRRVEFGLACLCTPKDAYDEIRLQIVENPGIRHELTVREGVDKSTSAQSFQPDKLVECMKALAKSPSVGADRLDLVIAKGQLLSFYRLKGYCQLPEFQFCEGLVENGVDTLQYADNVHTTAASKDDEHIYSGQGTSETQKSSWHKHKHDLKDSMYHRKKERSLSELMSGSLDSLYDEEFESDGKAGSKLVSPSSGKKRKAVDFAGDESSLDGRKTISLAKVSISTQNTSKPSFKIGECIRRAASQMTGSPSILKSNSDRLQKLDGDGFDVSLENFEDAEGKRTILPTDYSSLDDLLSQLYLAARDPMKGYSFFNIIISFFSDFRNSIISGRHSVDKAGGKRKKTYHAIVGSPETFEFEDMSDTYWTDRVIQNGAEEQPAAPPSSGRNSRGYQIVPVELKPAQKIRRSYSRKQFSNGNHDVVPLKPSGYVDENSPAELILNFSETNIIPSETNLNKMFRHFGPLKESETEVDMETSRARVVFKRCSDAEVAHSSAAKFNIFGPIVVNYQLSYSISEPFKASPMVTSLVVEYAT